MGENSGTFTYDDYMQMLRENAASKRRGIRPVPDGSVTVELPGNRLKRNLPPKHAGGPRQDLPVVMLHGRKPRSPKQVVEEELSTSDL